MQKTAVYFSWSLILTTVNRDRTRPNETFIYTINGFERKMVLEPNLTSLYLLPKALKLVIKDANKQVKFLWPKITGNSDKLAETDSLKPVNQFL